MTIATIEEIIADMRAGRMVILIDEEDRENEGDLVLAAEAVTPDTINFMAKYGRGLICLTLSSERCAQLDLPLMVSRNGAPHGTAFTVSIEAAEGVTTGISAGDRARTVLAAVAPNAKPRDIVMPGHIFPLMAQPGGVLMRAGHTEAGCDLASMAGFEPAAVICEIMKDDGEMARLPDLIEFGREHNIKIGTIADLIHYRSRTESMVERIGTRVMHTPFGTFDSYLYRDGPSGKVHLALVHGTPTPDVETVVRVHEPLTVLDMLDHMPGGHSWTVPAALAAISETQSPGVMVMLNCSGDTPESLQAQFNPASPEKASKKKRDLRTYGIGAQILRDLNVGKMRILASPQRMPSMTGFNLEITGYEAMSSSASE
jgi:3,4-dihydroxy 2-butanone 4-phosphate synthase/GTP cyclohydrolase II